MLQIKEAIVVEGRYDKNALSQVVDTLILETSGFGVFKNREQMDLLRRVAQRRGLIVLTDSDGAGFLIRNRIRGAIPASQVKHAYIPDIYGKERRKRKPGCEGKLGVEGMTPQILEEVLRRAGAVVRKAGEQEKGQGPNLTKADLMSYGLVGMPDSAKRRKDFLTALELPEYVSANALLDILNSCYSWDEIQELLNMIKA